MAKRVYTEEQLEKRRAYAREYMRKRQATAEAKAERNRKAREKYQDRRAKHLASVEKYRRNKGVLPIEEYKAKRKAEAKAKPLTKNVSHKGETPEERELRIREYKRDYYREHYASQHQTRATGQPKSPREPKPKRYQQHNLTRHHRAYRSHATHKPNNTHPRRRLTPEEQRANQTARERRRYEQSEEYREYRRNISAKHRQTAGRRPQGVNDYVYCMGIADQDDCKLIKIGRSRRPKLRVHHIKHSYQTPTVHILATRRFPNACDAERDFHARYSEYRITNDPLHRTELFVVPPHILTALLAELSA